MKGFVKKSLHAERRCASSLKNLVTAGAIATTVVLTGCGGGGGGDSSDSSDNGPFVGAANVSMELTPRRLDPGDRAQLKIEVSEVHENGILLKIRHPAGLRYVPESAILTTGKSQETEVNPLADVDGTRSQRYLVFCLDNDALIQNRGELMLELRGIDQTEEGTIEVDPDVKATNTVASCQFSVEEPEFNVEESLEVTVTE